MSKNRDIDNLKVASNTEFKKSQADFEGSACDGVEEQPEGRRQPCQPVGTSDDDGVKFPPEDESSKKFQEWSTETLMNDPEGIDAAIARNNALMEQKTREVIENGSLEEIAAALEENTRQLQMLHDRMQNLFKIMG